MAVVSTQIPSPPTGLTYVIDVALTKTDVLVKNGACTLHQIKITNTGNASTPFYTAFWDGNDVSNVTHRTNNADLILYCPAASTQTYVIPAGISFGTGIIMAGSTDLAATTFTPTNAGNAPTVELLIK